MTDEIFRSMKAQMEPSDDVVSELLAMIAAESTSPATENENVIPFAKAAQLRKAAPETAAASAVIAEIESAPRKQIANTPVRNTSHTGTNKKKKSIWYYGTAVAASIIVMISTFALLDPSEEGGGVGDLITNVVGGDSTIVNPANPDGAGSETGDNPALPPVGSDGQDSQDGENQTGNSDEPNADGSKEGQNPEGSSGNEGSNAGEGQTNAGSADGESDYEGSYGEENYDDPDAYSNPGKQQDSSTGSGDNNANTGKGQGNSNSGKESGGQTPSSGSNDGKVTPGAVGSGNIAWNSEILNASQVASISVSGSNYVVGSTVSRSDMGATLDTVTIDLPQTSSTNAAQVTAKVCELKNVSSDAVVALDVEGFTQPLIYANADYSPSTLGQFVTDLGLEGNIAFSNKVRCQISQLGYSSNQNYTADVNSGAWIYLLSQSSGERGSKSAFNSGSSKALFTSSSNPTGSQMQFGVSDSGYLQITMLKKTFYFYIGPENAIGFLEYVTGETIG